MHAQCVHNISYALLRWDNNFSITVKYNVKPPTDLGQIYISKREGKYLSEPSKQSLKLNSDNTFSYGNFNDIEIKQQDKYEYNLKLFVNGKMCDDTTLYLSPRAFDSGSSLDSGKLIQNFTTKEVYNITPSKLKVRDEDTLKISLELKDASFAFKTGQEFFLLSNNRLYITDYAIKNDDDQSPFIIIHRNSPDMKSCRVALIQDNIIIGLSSSIVFDP